MPMGTFTRPGRLSPSTAAFESDWRKALRSSASGIWCPRLPGNIGCCVRNGQSPPVRRSNRNCCRAISIWPCSSTPWAIAHCGWSRLVPRPTYGPRHQLSPNGLGPHPARYPVSRSLPRRRPPRCTATRLRGLPRLNRNQLRFASAPASMRPPSSSPREFGVGIFPRRMIEAYRPSGTLAAIATKPSPTIGRVYLAHHVTADADRIEAVMRVIESVTANLNYFDLKGERRKPPTKRPATRRPVPRR